MASRRKPPAKGKRAAGKPPAGDTLTHAEVMGAAARVDPELRRRSELLWDDRSRATRGTCSSA